MDHQNLQKRSVTPTEIPAKRKRGRPRKDENIAKRERPQVPISPASDTIRNYQHLKVNPSITRIDNNMVGQMVSGVIEGTFDAGYFIAVRAGQSSTILRGVVFQPGRFVPITPANDIAPQAKMYPRGEFRLPVPNPQAQAQANCSSPQSAQNLKRPAQLVGHTVAPMTAHQVLPFGQQHFQPTVATVPPHVMQKKHSGISIGGQIAAPENLRMVEQDEVMQVFEVSKPLDEPKVDSEAAKNKQAMESEIGPSKLVEDQVKSPTHGFQEVPSIAILRSPSPESENVESGIKSGGLLHNDLNCPNLDLHHASIRSEPQSSEAGFKTIESLHNEQTRPNIDQKEAPEPMPNELVPNELKSVNLEAVPSEATSLQMDIVMENPVSGETSKQTERDVEILSKDQHSYSENPVIDAVDFMAKVSPSKPEREVEESAFQQRTEPEILTSASQTTDVDFDVGNGIQPTQHHSTSSNISEGGN